MAAECSCPQSLFSLRDALLLIKQGMPDYPDALRAVSATLDVLNAMEIEKAEWGSADVLEVLLPLRGLFDAFQREYDEVERQLQSWKDALGAVMARQHQSELELERARPRLTLQVVADCERRLAEGRRGLADLSREVDKETRKVQAVVQPLVEGLEMAKGMIAVLEEWD